ncbi:ATP-binding protein [Streptosporangium sp. NPDC000396]|uniref:ATP-binding protein n=1 Tax=Streptosporangium sp. NPDC000396 TaxID=3366185 RepID=UPI00367EA9FA
MRSGGRLGHHGDTEVLPHTWRREFPGEGASIPEARVWARELLGGRVAAPILDDVLLLLSEVVTNAVTHSDSGRTLDGRVTVYVTRAPGVIHVEVVDDGSATSAPAVQTPEADSDGGRGLWLVDLIATAWGSHHDDEAGGSVWFQVAD